MNCYTQYIAPKVIWKSFSDWMRRIHSPMIKLHPSPVEFLRWTLPSICHRTYFHTSKGHVTWIIKKVNRIPTHCGVANESVHSLARGHVIRVWIKLLELSVAKELPIIESLPRLFLLLAPTWYLNDATLRFMLVVTWHFRLSTFLHIALVKVPSPI